MKKRTKVLVGFVATLFGLALLLTIHIYMVSRSKADASTRVMARIDVHQPLTAAQAVMITSWLYRQKGIDHVLCNPHTAIVVFTFSPLEANANAIAASFRTALHYPNSNRYIPTAKELRGGCPVASTSAMYRICSTVKQLIQ